MGAEMMEQDREALTKLSAQMAEARTPTEIRSVAKKLMVLCWMQLTAGDRWSFWDNTGPNTLEFIPPDPSKPRRPSEFAYILRRWPEIVPRIHDQRAREFAQQIQRRCKFRGFNPSEKQREWIMQLWKDYGTEEPEPMVLEDD